MSLTDSHCHLDDSRFDADRAAVVGMARAAGVSTMLAIGTGGGPPDLACAVRLADEYPGVYATLGVHPHHAAAAEPGTFGRMRELFAHPKVVAIGEIGLDYHYDFAPRSTQRRVFESQLSLAADARLPVSIHTREAWADTLDVLRAHPLPSGGVFHCFTGGPREAEQALAIGFHLSFAGILTFPNAHALREAAALTPLDRLLVETDAPYLAPVPYRGKRNEPSFLTATARCLALAKGASEAEIAAITTKNFERLCLRRAAESL